MQWGGTKSNLRGVTWIKTEISKRQAIYVLWDSITWLSHVNQPWIQLETDKLWCDRSKKSDEVEYHHRCTPEIKIWKRTKNNWTWIEGVGEERVGSLATLLLTVNQLRTRRVTDRLHSGHSQKIDAAECNPIWTRRFNVLKVDESHLTCTFIFVHGGSE